MPDVPKIGEKKKEVVTNEKRQQGGSRNHFLRNSLLHSDQFSQSLQDMTSTSTQQSGDKRNSEAKPAQDTNKKKK